MVENKDRVQFPEGQRGLSTNFRRLRPVSAKARISLKKTVFVQTVRPTAAQVIDEEYIVLPHIHGTNTYMYYIHSTLLTLNAPIFQWGIKPTVRRWHPGPGIICFALPSRQSGLLILCTRQCGTCRWMSSNRLRLNAQKTNFIWFGTRQQLANLRRSRHEKERKEIMKI